MTTETHEDRTGRRRLGRPAVIALVIAGLVGAVAVGAVLRKVSEPAAVTRDSDKPMSFPEIFDRVAPAVVSVETEGGRDRPLLQFLQPPQTDEDDGSQSAGSGFFMSSDGLVVTNDHVIGDAPRVFVVLNDGRRLPAEIVGRDPGSDLAVIRAVDPRNRGRRYPYVDFEDSARPRVGDWVLAVGNPFGLGGSASAGIVSAYGRDVADSGLVEYLQLDAAINRGDFGGPTFDVYGRVVGVNTTILSPNGGSIGIGFAIPADVAAETVKVLADGKEIVRGYIGASIQTLTPTAAAAKGLEGKEGALVAGVAKGGPAEAGGLKVGDVVVAADGDPVDSSSGLTRRVAAVQPGRTVRLEVLRDGKSVTLAIKTGTRPPPRELETVF